MGTIRKYTKEEEELILNNSRKKSNKISYEDLAKQLNRTVEGIRKKEKDLKNKYLHNKRLNNKWTEEEENIIREYISQEGYTFTGLINLIKKDIRTIEAKTLEISIELKKNKKAFAYWTKEDEEYLKKWYGIERPIIMGIYLGRSLESIHQKAKKMKLGGKKIHYTARECASILGLEDSTFLNYLYKGYVKSRKAVTEQLIHQIQIEDLYDFMKNHQDKWDSRNLSYEPFLIEKPDWYIEKCKRDQNSPIGYLNKFNKWSDEEVNTLYSMVEAGASFRDIADKLNRTVSSVENRWRKRKEIEARKERLKKKEESNALLEKQKETLNRLIEEADNEKSYIERKVYKITTKSLSEDDIELLSNLRMVGFSNSEIGEMVGKCTESIRQAFIRNRDEEYVINIKGMALIEEEKKCLFNKANEGYSMYELCLEFKKSYDDIIRYYKEVLKEKEKETYIDGLKHKVWTNEDDNNLLKLRAQGLTDKVIAYKLGKTVSSVRNRYYVLSKNKKTS